MAEEKSLVFQPLLTVAEAAKYLGVGRRTIYQLIEWGEIRTVKVEGSTRIEQASLERWRYSGSLT
jgi:excisionase family DNA binding protein